MFKEDDVILHRPSGEEWVVRRMVGNDYVECKGWPTSQAKVSDCEFVRKWTNPLKNFSPPEPRSIEEAIGYDPLHD